MTDEKTKRKLLLVSFGVTILYALHFAVPLYANSTFLQQFFTNYQISFLFAGAFSLTFIASTYLSKFLHKYHNYETTLLFLILNFFSVSLLGFVTNPIFVALLFTMFIIFSTLLYSTINIFIEEFKGVHDIKNDNTVSVRGVFLTLLNFGILLSPLICSLLLMQGGFKYVFVFSALTLIPIAFLIRHFFAHIPEPKYKEVNVIGVLVKISRDKNLSGVMTAVLILEGFFSIMAVYTPLYLVNTIGLTTTQYLGVILPFALIPFVLLPYELGVLADTKIGEKEMMIIGIIIILTACALFPFITTKNVIVWTVFLAFSRVGAAMLEAMSYTYFFKKVHPTDVASISLFANIRTVANAIVPSIAAVIILAGGNMTAIMITFIICSILGLRKVFLLKDTL